MEITPIEWVEKIFAILETFFCEKWKAYLGNEDRHYVIKRLWQTALSGLTKDEIREALKVAKQLAKHDQPVPSPIEMYYYAKGKEPYIPYSKPKLVPNPAISSSAINEIRAKLGRLNVPRRTEDRNQKAKQNLATAPF